MLGHDERAAQRDHHENAEEPAQQRDQHHPRDFQIQSQDHDCRHGHANAERDRLSRRTCRLHNIVFENGGVAEAKFRKQPEQCDRDYGHRNRSAHRQSNLQNQIKRRRAKHHAQKSAHDQRQYRQFPQTNFGRYVWLEALEIRVVRLKSYPVRIFNCGCGLNRVYGTRHQLLTSD